MKIHIETGENWDKIEEELLSTKRTGIEALIKFLDSSDFKLAPASTKYHLNTFGGLAEHSLNVLKFARKTIQNLELDIEDDSLILTSLLHDICKINFYKLTEILDLPYKDKTGIWRKIPGWKIEDQFPIGHGEKSAIIAVKYIDLKANEIAAIRFHMGRWDSHDSAIRTMRDAMDKYPLVKIIAIADQLAECYEVNADYEKLDEVVKTEQGELWKKQ